MFLTYVFANIGVALISSELKVIYDELKASANPDAEELATLDRLVEYTMGVDRWMFTLVQVLTLDSWSGIAHNLEPYCPGSWLLFYSYISVTVVVFMNLVTAVIVENAMRNSKLDDQTILIQAEREEKRTMKAFKHLFLLMDEDGDGTLTLEEFSDAFDVPEVSAKLRLMGFKREDCQVIFHLLDEGDGSLTLDEFFAGLSSMKGPATGKQMFLIKKQLERVWEVLTVFGAEAQEDMRALTEGLTDGKLRAQERQDSLVERARTRQLSLQAEMEARKNPELAPDVSHIDSMLEEEEALKVTVDAAGNPVNNNVTADAADDPASEQKNLLLSMQQLISSFDALNSEVKSEMQTMSSRLARVEEMSTSSMKCIDVLKSFSGDVGIEPKLRENRGQPIQGCCGTGSIWAVSRV
eukprot:TRINITY_DN79632_c0_g1_i1.p1 TRINITY_DN79632_c0_g1~~TRINITY_DN79632_c0_g1_i1.p1  ORF type:complete len:465 (-),score=83.90 TRINITY_DN79632_c0_g1_i1:142-1371(-)